MKTPPKERIRKRNAYREKHGIPVKAPLYGRTRPNKPRAGHGNQVKPVSMPEESWERLDALRAGVLTRGQVITEALKHHP